MRTALKKYPKRIKNIKYIDAIVKIFKCKVDSVSVDISGYQMGGMSTLCFLANMNEKFGKNDILKKSIILLKAWSLKEAKILASHQGFLSAYALIVLIMFILNRFYDEIDTPFQALYKFLEYYSKFDWENMGIGLEGPFPMATLSDQFDELSSVDYDSDNCVVSMKNTDDDTQTQTISEAQSEMELNSNSYTEKMSDIISLDSTSFSFEAMSGDRDNESGSSTPDEISLIPLHCSKDFLNYYNEKYGFKTSNSFPRKCINILDPMRVDNNLGRSVSPLNFPEITKAFNDGFQLIYKIKSEGNYESLLNKFFFKTWRKYQKNISNVDNGISNFERSVDVFEKQFDNALSYFCNGIKTSQTSSMGTITLQGIEIPLCIIQRENRFHDISINEANLIKKYNKSNLSIGRDKRRSNNYSQNYKPGEEYKINLIDLINNSKINKRGKSRNNTKPKLKME